MVNVYPILFTLNNIYYEHNSLIGINSFHKYIGVYILNNSTYIINPNKLMVRME